MAIGAGLDSICPALPGLVLKFGRESRPVVTASLRAIQAAVSRGVDVYFARMVQLPGSTGHSLRDAMACFGIAQDIDTDESGTKNRRPCFTSKEAAFNQLWQAIVEGQLPEPSAIVDSGRGLHVYWSTVDLMPVQEAKSIGIACVDVLKSIDERLICDTSALTNPIGLLRMPGTRNFKYVPPVKVQLLHEGERIPVARLKLLFPPADVDGSMKKYKSRAQATSTSLETGSGSVMHTKCSGIRYYLDKIAPYKGYYVAWSFIFNFAPYIKDGVRWARTWSAGEQYDPERLDAELVKAYDKARERQANPTAHPGPGRCTAFLKAMGTDKSICGGCPLLLRDSSPVNLMVDTRVRTEARGSWDMTANIAEVPLIIRDSD